MEFFQYLLGTIISSVGLLMGIIQAKISPEELGPGKDYYLYLKKICLLVMLALLFFTVIKILIIPILLVIASAVLIYASTVRSFAKMVRNLSKSLMFEELL